MATKAATQRTTATPTGDVLPLQHGDAALSYPARIRPADGVFLVEFPDFPDVIEYGDTYDAAKRRAWDALIAALQHIISKRQPVPEPSLPRDGDELIRLGQLEMTKLRIYRLMLEQGLSNSALAERLGKGETQVRRLLSLRHSSRISELEKAFAVLHRRMLIVEG